MNNTIVDIREASIHQHDGKQVLAGVNLRISKGEFIYLIGKTGSGKSSLLKTLYGDLIFKQGTGKVCNYDLKTLDRKSIPLLRRQLGIVFQDFNLLEDRNVEDNLRFVLKATGWKEKGRMNARIEKVLEQVGLKHKNLRMPFEMSGGEQQRVVIARALLNNPQLIIADEPTGNLDPDTSDDILLLLRRLSKDYNTAVLFATHDYRILENFPARILRCHQTQLIDEEAIGI